MDDRKKTKALESIAITQILMLAKVISKEYEAKGEERAFEHSIDEAIQLIKSNHIKIVTSSYTYIYFKSTIKVFLTIVVDT